MVEFNTSLDYSEWHMLHLMRTGDTFSVYTSYGSKDVREVCEKLIKKGYVKIVSHYYKDEYGYERKYFYGDEYAITGLGKEKYEFRWKRNV